MILELMSKKELIELVLRFTTECTKDYGPKFKKGESYFVDQDRDYVYVADDSGEVTPFTYDQAKEYFQYDE